MKVTQPPHFLTPEMLDEMAMARGGATAALGDARRPRGGSGRGRLILGEGVGTQTRVWVPTYRGTFRVDTAPWGGACGMHA